MSQTNDTERDASKASSLSSHTHSSTASIKNDGSPHTPKRQKIEDTRTNVFETPTIQRVSFNKGSGADLKEDRNVNLADIGYSVREVTRVQFFSEFLPPLQPGHDVSRVLEKLEKMGTLKNEVWAGFTAPPRKRDKVHEDDVFEPAEKIIGAISQACCEVFRTSTNVVFLCNPTHDAEGSLRSTTSRPDGYFLIVAPLDKARVNWATVAIVAEFKKGITAQQVTDNNSKILWHIRQLLCNDPCRMTAYGFTICNTDMRMWYADRSAIVVSEPFDFTQEHTDVVRFFMSALFASHEQLGWDPTMKRVGDYSSSCFDITVRERSGATTTFRTTDIISLTKAESILGSATRVWRCNELDEQQNPIPNCFVALKDNWVDSDKSPEGENYEELRSAAASSQEPWVLDAIEQTLLKVKCHGYVSVDGSLQATKEVPDDSQEYKVIKLTEHQEDGDARAFQSQLFVRSHAGFIKTKGPEVVRHRSKRHYRIVFEEVGDQLHRQNSLWRIFISLGLVFRGFQAMHYLGYAHRDISSSNILVLGKEARIADLEYLKRYDTSDSACHTIRTATSFFMAVETDSKNRRYIFQSGFYVGHKPELPKANEGAKLLSMALQGGAARLLSGSAPQLRSMQAPRLVPFRFNALHDLESVFWITAYFITFWAVVLARPLTILQFERLERQKEYAQDLFHDKQTRYTAITTPPIFRQCLMEFLDPSMLAAGEEVASLADLLCKAYKDAEKDIKGDPNYFKNFVVSHEIHDQFFSRLYTLCALFQDSDITIYRLDTEASPKTTKKQSSSKTSGSRATKRKAGDISKE